MDNANYAVSFSSGCAAIHALLHLLKPGDHLVSCNEQYGGADVVISKYSNFNGIEMDFVDTTDLKQIEEAIKPNTRVIIMTKNEFL